MILTKDQINELTLLSHFLIRPLIRTPTRVCLCGDIVCPIIIN